MGGGLGVSCSNPNCPDHLGGGVHVTDPEPVRCPDCGNRYALFWEASNDLIVYCKFCGSRFGVIDGGTQLVRLV